ncbi:MAG: macro domain-containing protein [Verrucomicrobiia bacterium]|jgi:O-acetyl-ADP-ribose deacetylase (regulator of RNase III)/uncharacterized protein YwgA
MVKVLIGDLFQSKAQTFVNTVNCVGIMGKGVALEFKKRFPEMFEDYEHRCLHHEVRLGRPYLYKSLVLPWVLNFPTKDHWRSVTKLEDIIQGLDFLLAHYKQWGIASLAVPPLGCGNGQLEWRVVGRTLYRYFSRMDIPVEVYAPYGTPHAELQPSFLGVAGTEGDLTVSMPQPHFIRPAWVALVEILRRIEEQPYHHPVGRVFFQKIANVATDQGLPTGLEYRRSSFGPFSPDLKGVTARLINNGLLVEEQQGKMFNVHVGRTFTDASKSYALDLERWEPIIERTADLFMRLDSQQAEIAATVLFAARSTAGTEHDKPTERQVFDEVMKWKQRRRPPLNEQEVASTIRNLAALGWLNVKASEDLPLPEDILAHT